MSKIKNLTKERNEGVGEERLALWETFLVTTNYL